MVDRWLAKKLSFRNPSGQTLLGVRQADSIAIRKFPELISPEPTLKTLQSIDSKVSEVALLQRVASLLAQSPKPLARAILLAAQNKKVELLSVTQRSENDALIIGWVMDRKLLLGQASAIKKEGVNLGPLESLAHALSKDGQTVMIIAAEGRPLGLISVHFALRPEIEQKYSQLGQSYGLKVLWTNELEEGVAFEFRHQGRALVDNKDLNQLEPSLILSQKTAGLGRQALAIGITLASLASVALFLNELLTFIPLAIALGALFSWIFPFWRASHIMRAAQQNIKPS
jgi:hypothetical protein